MDLIRSIDAEHYPCRSVLINFGSVAIPRRSFVAVLNVKKDELPESLSRNVRAEETLLALLLKLLQVV